MTTQPDPTIRERLRELAAKERGRLAGLPPPKRWDDRAASEAAIREGLRSLDTIEATLDPELDTLERRVRAAEGLREALDVALADWESRRVGIIPGGPTARLVGDLRFALKQAEARSLISGTKEPTDG